MLAACSSFIDTELVVFVCRKKNVRGKNIQFSMFEMFPLKVYLIQDKNLLHFLLLSVVQLKHSAVDHSGSAESSASTLGSRPPAGPTT